MLGREHAEVDMDPLFSKKHNVLLHIAAWVRFGAWLFLVLYAISFVLRVVTLINDLQSPGTGYGTFQVQGFGDAPDAVAIAERVVFALRAGILGVVWFMVLRGVALGLRMIVETDVNYRSAASAGEPS